jgi:hypothetical protein
LSRLWKKCVSAATEAETQSQKTSNLVKILSSLRFGPVRISSKHIFFKDWLSIDVFDDVICQIFELAMWPLVILA